MEKAKDNHHLALFIAKCKQHHLKITPQRISIWEELIKSKNHPSAATLFRIIKEKFPHISFDTVNRTLLTFFKIGIIDVVEGRGDPRRFDPDVSEHDHFHCVNCGHIMDLHSEEYNKSKIPENIRKHCTVFSKRVVINGLCNKCGGEG